MKILAVIPACEGSRTLPNKNIRVIHGKPMIYYVINCARKSKYITDIIVTTNSSEVISIAKQMGVMSRLREPCLCSKEVSLDAVVFDVFRQVELRNYDYIVTMQSISPALETQTLDHAFRRIFEKGYDTLISVTNCSNFYWEIQGGKPVPMQYKRTNRHLLPPFYKETGAFLITRPCFIREDNRIGEHVGLYELYGEEAVDINTFGDLKQMEHAMDKKRTAFYVNGNNELGLGHISRVLQIADELYTKPDIYYDFRQTDVGSFGVTTHNLFPVDGTEGFLAAIAQADYDIIIHDILSTDCKYMKAVRHAAPTAKIINFEDDGEGARLADQVINALYEHSGHNNVKVGSKYYILPKLFLIYEEITIKDKVKNVVVTFGGADPQGYTEQMLKLARMPEFRGLHFYIVLGGAKQNAESLLKYGQSANMTILYNIDNMPEIMSRCDIAVTSRGRTCYELAALGIPTISIAQNEREEKHDFICKENGFSYIGTAPARSVVLDEVRKYVAMDREERKALQEKLLKNNLRHGRENVLELISGTCDENL